MEPIDGGRVERDLLRLLAIPSPALHEGAVMQAITELVDELGVTSEFDDAGERLGGEVGNLLVRLPGDNEGGEALFLNAHVDTVTPCEGVSPVLRDGVLYSRGDTVLGSDDKAGVVALLEALRVVREQGIPHGPVEVLFTVAEETGLNGAKAFAVSQLAARRGYVFDGSNRLGQGTLAAPSHENIEITVLGKAAHAGMRPEEGLNAITLASRALAELDLGRVDGETTANVGVIQGGLATNIVPERVVAQCEARSHDQAKLQAQLKRIEEAFRTATATGGGAVEFRRDPKYSAFAVAESDDLVRRASLAAERCGFEPHWKVGGGGSDANVFNERGLKTVILNCGQQNPHTTDECVAVSDVVAAAGIAVELIRSFATNQAAAG